MNDIKKCIYIVLIIVLLIILYKSIKFLTKVEGFDEANPEITEPEITEPGITKDSSNSKEPSKDKSIIDMVSEKVSELVSGTPTVEMAPIQVVSALENGTTHNVEGTQEEINIEPKFIDGPRGIIMDGSKMIPGKFLSPWAKAYTQTDKNDFLLSDGSESGKDYDIGFNYNSVGCGSPTYPPPFKVPINPEVAAHTDDFVPNPYMGMNDNMHDRSVNCMTKQQARHLATRGGNA